MWTRCLTSLAVAFALVACDEEKGHNEQREILATDAPRALAVIRQDLDDGMTGVRAAAERLAPGFAVEDPARREADLRAGLRLVQRPTRQRVPELMTLPITFLAAVGMDGKVIARDATEDRMRGFDLAEIAPVVQAALDGSAGHALSRIPSLLEDDPPSVTVLFAAPVRHEGQVVGALVAGLPLWRMTQQLSRQLQLEDAEEVRNGEIVWALLLEGDTQHFHAGFPPDLRELIPGPPARRAGLERSAGGFTGEVQQYGRWYGFGVIPVPTVGEDVTLILFRSEP